MSWLLSLPEACSSPSGGLVYFLKSLTVFSLLCDSKTLCLHLPFPAAPTAQPLRRALVVWIIWPWTSSRAPRAPTARCLGWAWGVVGPTELLGPWGERSRRPGASSDQAGLRPGSQRAHARSASALRHPESTGPRPSTRPSPSHVEGHMSAHRDTICSESRVNP